MPVGPFPGGSGASLARRSAAAALLLGLLLSACAAPSPQPPDDGRLQVLAVETFLADVTRNIAGDRVQVTSLLPLEQDPHSFELTPRDAARIADADLLIINGCGMEEWLSSLLDSTAREVPVAAACSGLQAPANRPGDPHFWLDPVRMIAYTENIRDALTGLDPAGKAEYDRRAADYIAQLQALDSWVREQVRLLPPERRVLLTNHDSLGYYADRYGFTVVGTLVESHSSGAAPSAAHLAELVDLVRATGVPAIFLETGADPRLADQIAADTGVKVVTSLQVHSITAAGGNAPSYLDMIRWNTRKLVEALRE